MNTSVPLQPLKDLENWYENDDPWEYETNLEDTKRKQILLNKLSKYTFDSVLDIGCGHGYITRELPGNKVVGVDISEKAISQATTWAKKHNQTHLKYVTSDLFDLKSNLKSTFDLIIITGVLYPQYIGNAEPLVYIQLDAFLKKGGLLVSVHVDEWYKSRFPYLMLDQHFYKYREYNHCMEIYRK